MHATVAKTIQKLVKTHVQVQPECKQEKRILLKPVRKSYRNGGEVVVVEGVVSPSLCVLCK